MVAKPAAVVYKISIADAARTDLDDILEWTTGAFGTAGRKRYEGLMQTALTDLLSNCITAICARRICSRAGRCP